jgi:two-component system sensor histidine kinase DesK
VTSVTTEVEGDAPTAWTRRDGRPGRLGVLFACVWLFFLVPAFQVGWDQRGSWRGGAGLACLLGFVVLYVAAFTRTRQRRIRGDAVRSPVEAATLLGGLLGLAVLACLTVGQAATAALVYVAVTSVMWLSGRAALVVVTLLAVASDLSTRVVPGWDHDSSLTFAICTAAFAMWGVNQLMLRNGDLMRARDENAVLAVSAERNRFARDLHDILGHSLTVITVKAELANRLLDVDTERARAELADLERLSRDALADVRRAVEGYRDLSLAGELARAREALTAAGIHAELPGSTDEVPSELRELFAWTVREGVTNVIRHSGATRCSVRLTPGAVEVWDDGSGPCPEGGAGHGLAGLRERAAAAGAVLVTRPVEPSGFALSVAAR